MGEYATTLINGTPATHCKLGTLDDWAPLERLFSPWHRHAFMAMGTVIQDGTQIHLYKHRDTRRYLNLDQLGQAYAYVPPSDALAGHACYQPIPLGDAIAHAFTCFGFD